MGEVVRVSIEFSGADPCRVRRSRKMAQSARLTRASVLAVSALGVGAFPACTKAPAQSGAEAPHDPAASSPAASAQAPAPVGVSLAQTYAAFFPIGAAVNSTPLHSHADLLAQHFNSITAENEMKFESLEKTEGKFDYAAADEMVA